MNGLHSRRRTGTFARFVELSAVKADSEYRLAGAMAHSASATTLSRTIAAFETTSRNLSHQCSAA
jgi:hypothetical protein